MDDKVKQLFSLISFGDVLFSGTIDNLTFYVMREHTYVRTKSSLTAERVLEDLASEKTRQIRLPA